MSEKQNDEPMSEQAQNVACTLIVAAAATTVICFFASCASGCDERQSERFRAEAQQEHDLKMEHVKQGHVYLEKGSWIKQPVP